MIIQFRGEHRWLSNFAPCFVSLDGLIYPTVENAYMSAKSDYIGWKIRCQQAPPGIIKKESRLVKLPPNWDILKVETMKVLLEQKFNRFPFNQLLWDTGEEIIQEGNTWNDRFWGVDLLTGQGLNTLGILIMGIREELRKKARPEGIYH